MTCIDGVKIQKVKSSEVRCRGYRTCADRVRLVIQLTLRAGLGVCRAEKSADTTRLYYERRGVERKGSTKPLVDG